MSGKFSHREIDAFTPEQFADAMAQSWAERDGETFLSLFTPDALIDHPLFVGSVPVDTILTAACRANVSSTIPRSADISEDTLSVKFHFDDFGVLHGIIPERMGTISATLKLRNKRAAHMAVHPFFIRSASEEDKALVLATREQAGIVPKGDQGRYSDREIDSMSPEQFAENLGKAWGNNDVATFVSFFTADALIHHPMFDEPVSPIVVGEILNGSYIGRTKFKQTYMSSPSTLVVLYDEEATDLPNPASMIPTMKILAELTSNRIGTMHVEGYTVRHAEQDFIPDPAPKKGST